MKKSKTKFTDKKLVTKRPKIAQIPIAHKSFLKGL